MTIVMSQVVPVTLRDTGPPEVNAQIRNNGANRSMEKDLPKKIRFDGEIRIETNMSGLGIVFPIGRNAYTVTNPSFLDGHS